MDFPLTSVLVYELLRRVASASAARSLRLLRRNRGRPGHLQLATGQQPEVAAQDQDELLGVAVLKGQGDGLKKKKRGFF